MFNLPLLFAAATFAIGTAQAGTVVMLNTFDSGQAAPSGGPGPAAPTFGANGIDANGLHSLGVTFTFSDPTSETYGAFVGVGPISNGLQGPSDTTITLTFDLPSTFLSFNALVGVFAPSGGQVTIGGSTTLFDTSNFSVASFSAGTVAPFTTAQITFNPSGSMYAIGNLSYDAATPTDGVPEPASLTLIGAGTLLLGVLLRRR